MSREWGIFNDESANYTEIEALEAGFYSREEAETVLKEKYSDDQYAQVHLVDDEPYDNEEEEYLDAISDDEDEDEE